MKMRMNSATAAAEPSAGTRHRVSIRSRALSTPTYSERRRRALRCRNSDPKNRPQRLRKGKLQTFAYDFSLVRVRGKFVLAWPRGACLWTTPARREHRGTAYPLACYHDVTNSLQGPDKWIPFSAPPDVAARVNVKRVLVRYSSFAYRERPPNAMQPVCSLSGLAHRQPSYQTPFQGWI